mgnify:CR=1 FL=1
MMYNIRIFSERIMWNNTTSCGLCNFPKLIQIHENKNTLKTYKIRASRCFCLWASGIGRGLERYRQGFVASRLRGGGKCGVCRLQGMQILVLADEVMKK